MALTFLFKLITPLGVQYEGEVEQVTAQNEIGEFGVLPQHIDFISSLVPGVVSIKIRDNNYERFVVGGGLAEVRDGAMTLLAADAETIERINPSEVSGEVAAAEEKLRYTSFYEPEYVNVQRELMLARAHQRALELRA